MRLRDSWNSFSHALRKLSLKPSHLGQKLFINFLSLVEHQLITAGYFHWVIVFQGEFYKDIVCLFVLDVQVSPS